MNAQELTTEVARLQERSDAQKEQIQRLENELRSNRAEQAEQIKRLDQELRSSRDKQEAFATENARLRSEIDELKKNKDIWNSRTFAAIVAIIGVIGGAVGNALITYFLRR